jgi:hypothetical protein
LCNAAELGTKTAELAAINSTKLMFMSFLLYFFWWAVFGKFFTLTSSFSGLDVTSSGEGTI